MMPAYETIVALVVLLLIGLFWQLCCRRSSRLSSLAVFMMRSVSPVTWEARSVWRGAGPGCHGLEKGAQTRRGVR